MSAASACDQGSSGLDAVPEAGPLPLPHIALPRLTCLPAIAPAGECARDADCGSARCVLDVATAVSDRGPVPLSCGAQQGLGSTRAACETRADCESGLCALSGSCLAPCRADADCDAGTFCVPVEMRVGPAALAPVMACARNLAFEPDVQLSPGPTAQTRSDSALVSMSIPGSSGVTMAYLEPSCGSALQVAHVADASGRSLFAWDDELNGRTSLNPVSNVGQLVPILVPNNPALTGYERGVDVQVLTSEASDIVSVVAARSVPTRHPILDLNVILVGAGSDAVEGGFHPGDPDLQALFDQLRDLYADLGIRLGTVRQLDVVGELRDELSVLASSVVHDQQGNTVGLDVPGLDRLFELSMGLDDGGLNLFLVSDMGDLLGISGGIPGALGVHGTAASGVAIAVDVVGLSEAPFVALHEMSHQMGLFHTSEFDGTWIEPLSDTPICTRADDQNGDGLLSPTECRGHGADNLMFWSGDGRTLTDQQRKVLQRSIVLR